MKQTIYAKFCIIIIVVSCGQRLIAQDAIIDKLDESDSLTAIKTKEITDRNVVTKEVHNLFFRNIYRSSNYNEEEEFNKQIAILNRFDNKIIDSIIIIQVNSFGENVYDSTIRSNGFETFLSQKIHANTRQRIIRNRFLIIKKGHIFSPYRVYENSRLIRSVGIFHDVRIQPIISPLDTNHVVVQFILQDAFPYSVAIDPASPTRYGFGFSNNNIAGTMHQLSSYFRVNTQDHLPFGYRFDYRFPNIIPSSFIDLYANFQNYSNDQQVSIGVGREFVRPDITWAGGLNYVFRNGADIDVSGVFRKLEKSTAETWISHAFPLKNRNNTIHAFVAGAKMTYTNHSIRPTVSPTQNFKYWNSTLALGSIGYTKIKYIQDRLLNGFGRTEDIPVGLSINALYGREFGEFEKRSYFGLQMLNRFYNSHQAYLNITTKLGTYINNDESSQGVADFNIQAASQTFRVGKLRIRNFANFRTTIGINRDSTDFITLRPNDGIRGADNFSFQGNHRYTASFQSNLFLPITIAGFRFSVFGLVELAKINYDFSSTLKTPLRSGATLGVAVRNENLIFDVLQFQYGFYPTTSNLTNRGFVISSILPFRFQNLDISKPNLPAYE